MWRRPQQGHPLARAWRDGLRRAHRTTKQADWNTSQEGPVPRELMEERS